MSRGKIPIGYLTAKITGFFSLVLTTILWGTSFVFIKLSMSEIDPFTYTYTRMIIASITLLPFIIYKKMRGNLDVLDLRNGFFTGLAYSTGLCLQAAGTIYVDPSTSAFITGLSSLHVHLYTALIMKMYKLMDFTSLVLAMMGLYILTTPTGGLGLGEILVFSSTFFWAIQIVLIGRYSGSSLLEFLFGMFTAGALYVFSALITPFTLTREALLYITYLALVCSISATLFQVLGQRYVSESTAALIFLLEPVFAMVFSVVMGLEKVELHKVIGGGLIVFSLFTITISEIKYRNRREQVSITLLEYRALI